MLAKGVWSRIPQGILYTVAEKLHRFIVRNEHHWIKPRCNGKRWRLGLLDNLQFYTLYPMWQSRKESRDSVVLVIAS